MASLAAPKRKPAHSAEDASSKRMKLLDESDSEGDGAEEQFNINEGYAKRFEHNKKRAELHRLEEKYGKGAIIESGSESDSEDETEDEDGEFANESIDQQISATLDAIRSKDPRIYKEDTTFFTEGADDETVVKAAKEKPMYLREYHTKNLLSNGGNDEEDELPYAQQQRALKSSVIKEFNTAKNDDEDSDDDFLTRKEPSSKESNLQRTEIPDPKIAEQNPETFLSNFFASRAWVPTDKSTFQPLESDDDEDEERADQFEQAWNLRYEDPETSNKVLTTHSREVVAKYSVRRDELSGRQKAREREKQKKLDEKLQRKEERRRLKTLKVRDMEQKLELIKEAAGLAGKDISVEQWADMLDGDWEDEQWSKEMQRRFGDDYYEEQEVVGTEELEGSKKPKKPKWDDDIDIKDLVEDFEEEGNAPIELSEEDSEVEVSATATVSKSKAALKAESKANARRDRRILEALADQSLSADVGGRTDSFKPFNYRETSPNAFGLTPLDILAADDAQLNQFAGLKKLASFRDPERKKQDKKKLSKKARLRAWRKDTFGREDGPPQESLFKPVAADEPAAAGQEDSNSGSANKKKRKRKNKSKSDTGAVEGELQIE